MSAYLALVGTLIRPYLFYDTNGENANERITKNPQLHKTRD